VKIRLKDTDFWRPRSRRAEAEPVELDLSFKDIRFYAQFVKPLWKYIALSLLFTLLATSVSSLTPLSGKILIDYVFMKKPPVEIVRILDKFHLHALAGPLTSIFRSLNSVLLLGLAFGLILGLMSIFRNLVNFRITSETTFNVQTALFDRVLRFPMAMLKQKKVGYLMSRITGDVYAVQSLFSQSAAQLLTNILAPIFSFFILFQLNARITLILLAIVPFNVVFNYFVLRRSIALSYRQMEESAHYSGDMQEALTGVEVIKSYGAERRESNKVAGKMRRVIRLQLKSTMLQSVAGYVMNAYNLGAKLFITWLCGRAVLKGNMTIGDLTSFTLYALSLSSMLSGLFNQLISFQSLFVSMARLHEMFKISPEYESEESFVKPPVKPGSDGAAGPVRPALRPETVRGGLEFRGVSFAYEEKTPVLKDISLTVDPGETVAIMGVSGVGKTTLISLILKFYKPQGGRIALDGRDLEDIDTLWLRNQVGIVSQETFLFNDTIEHNIKYGDPAATLDAVREAARKARIDRDIAGFGEGYKTKVGERGTMLSVGQKQRISLARVFLKDPRVLILDEPTSALDRDTERELGVTLADIARGRTTFIITHRTPLVDIADRVFELREGQLVEIPK
jgi:ABC-type multidrug transport system fused ATPase/permease subunit